MVNRVIATSESACPGVDSFGIAVLRTLNALRVPCLAWKRAGNLGASEVPTLPVEHLSKGSLCFGSDSSSLALVILVCRPCKSTP